MASNSTNSTEDTALRHSVGFPHDLYTQASKAAAEDKVILTVQVLDETMTLFSKNHSAASWEERTADNFLGVVSRQADGLRSCGHGAEVWELIRKEIKAHLMTADQLISSLLNAN
ncbi:interferon phi 4 isoform X2 [Xyrichtys novacula]|uniref:Interferon phi 4 isoform X2 n=1 Tax=Xyrichtys novacula TaxID=13765 RepID=A0AAV1H292_XYRNO|nr:interferon phi 4 isoform X2 [Xyrichtys novacula]